MKEKYFKKGASTYLHFNITFEIPKRDKSKNG